MEVLFLRISLRRNSRLNSRTGVLEMDSPMHSSRYQLIFLRFLKLGKQWYFSGSLSTAMDANQWTSDLIGVFFIMEKEWTECVHSGGRCPSPFSIIISGGYGGGGPSCGDSPGPGGGFIGGTRGWSTILYSHIIIFIETATKQEGRHTFTILSWCIMFS